MCTIKIKKTGITHLLADAVVNAANKGFSRLEESADTFLMMPESMV